MESLASHSATTTHGSVTEEQRGIMGITQGRIRLSIGIEDKEDLIADLEQASGSGVRGCRELSCRDRALPPWPQKRGEGGAPRIAAGRQHLLMLAVSQVSESRPGAPV